MDYNLEIEVKIMTFQLWFIYIYETREFFGRERECDLEMGREWE